MVVYHAGFMTYLLAVAVVLVLIGVADPPLFHQITDVISQLAKAARGG